VNIRDLKAVRRGAAGTLALAAVAAGGLLAICGPAGASETFSLGGYYKNFSTVLDFPDLVLPPPSNTDVPLLGAVSNRLRLQARWRPLDRLTLTAAYNLVPRVQDRRLFDTDLFATGIDPGRYRVTDLRARLYPKDKGDVASFAVYQDLDRLLLTVTMPRFDLTVGRQPIAWGSAHAVNPTDVIAPYTFNELDTEDRVGVDAVRLRYPLGFMGELDIGYVGGEDLAFEKSAFFLRGRYYAFRTDFAALLVGFREHLLVGVDVTRAVGGAGAWVEGAYVITDALADSGRDSGHDYLRASVGLDYSLGPNTYAFLEYHLSTAGALDAGDYYAVSSTPAYTDGAVYLLGRHYAIPGVSYQITPLVTASGEALVNLTDWSVLIGPAAEYNVAKDVYLAIGAFVGFGKEPEHLPGAGSGGIPMEFNSEFGTYADLYYVSFRVYF